MSTRPNSRGLAEFICWAEKLAACLDHGLTDEEFKELDRWDRERDPELTTGDWPGWAPHIGPRPGAAIPSPSLHPLIRKK